MHRDIIRVTVCYEARHLCFNIRSHDIQGRVIHSQHIQHGEERGRGEQLAQHGQQPRQVQPGWDGWWILVRLLHSDDYLCVVTNDIGCASHLGADLLTLGGDHLLAVLDGGDVHHSLAHGLGHLPAGGHGHLLALLHGDRLTDWSSGHHGRGSVAAIVASISLSSSLSLGCGLSLGMMSGGEGSSSVVSLGGNMSHQLAVVAHHGGVVSGLGADLLTGGGDHLLAVLGHGRVHDLIILGVTLLSGVLNLAMNHNSHSMVMIILSDLSWVASLLRDRGTDRL